MAASPVCPTSTAVVSPQHDAEAKRMAYQQRSKPPATEPKQEETKHDKPEDEELPVETMNTEEQETIADAEPKRKDKDTPKIEKELFTSSDENEARYMLRL